MRYFEQALSDVGPGSTVINGFRLRHLDRFVDVFVQVLRLCG